jgi:hypothetical protein
MTISQLSPEEQEKKRALWRTAQQKTRNKKREAKSDPLEEQAIRKMEQEELERRQKLGQCFFGEIAPGVDASTIEDALQVAREMARAVGISDIADTESLLEFERRTFDAWARYDKFKDRLDCCWGGGGGPFLNRKTQTLTPGWGEDFWLNHCGGFDKCWTVLPGATVPIDVSGLAPLKEIPKPKPEPTKDTQPDKLNGPSGTPSVEEMQKAAAQREFRAFYHEPLPPPDALRYLSGGEVPR